MIMRKYDNEQHPGHGLALTRIQAGGGNRYSGDDSRGNIIIVGCRNESSGLDEREVKSTRSSSAWLYV